MSLSKAMVNETGKKKRKVILGPDASGLTELSLDELEDRGRRDPWSRDSEDEFFDRVRDKAKAKAKEIITIAMSDAEHIKAQAAKEGFAQGMAQAEQDIQALLGEKATALASILEQAQGGSKAIWEEYRQDIVTLVSMAVEKVLAVEVDQRRREVLGSLLDEALENVDSQRNLLVKVHPNDAEIMGELLTAAAKAHGALKDWRVKPDKDIAQGGVVLESDKGMVDNTVASRREIVCAVFDKLGLIEDSNGGDE
jgi:flagellar assembly protein FliH